MNNKNLILLILVLVILVTVAALVVLLGKNPFSQGTCTESCNIATKSSTVPSDTIVDLPAGFTLEQCAIIVSPNKMECSSEYPLMRSVYSYRSYATHLEKKLQRIFWMT